ncbi:uncharacterized protein [Dermacentor albipictus]|uniref:uncharacterized protein n=1 Tax=Dermacentor albipictus TaxID=60249 RepID=UPI0038FCEE0E
MAATRAQTDGPPAGAKCKVKLPKLELQRFSGAATEWQSFWEQFEQAVHGNDGLSNAEKFLYLRSVLSGKAAAAIAGIQVTGANYTTVIELLKERFGRRDVLIQEHLTQLLDLPTVQNEKVHIGLRRLYDHLQRNIAGLTALGVKTDSYGALLSSALLRMLPTDLVVGYYKELSAASKDGAISIKSLQAFLKTEVESREKALQPQHSIGALEIPEICSDRLHVPEDILKEVQAYMAELADVTVAPAHLMGSGIDILIGADYYWTLVCGEVKKLQGALVAVKTEFGWTLQGAIPSSSSAAYCSTVAVLRAGVFADTSSLSKELKSFRELESIGIIDSCTQTNEESEEVMSTFSTSAEKMDKRYEVALPWKPLNMQLADSKAVAKMPLTNLTKKLMKDESTLIKYGEAIPTVRHHLSTTGDYPEIRKSISESLYVDDLITGANTVEEATDFYRGALDVMNRASMTLRKWNSNSKKLQQLFNDEGTGCALGYVECPTSVSRVLGFVWDKDRDHLAFSMEAILDFLDRNSNTKRFVLQASALQFEAFQEELQCLCRSTGMPSDSPMRDLSVIYDDDGVMRVGGRLGAADLSYNVKHPVLLPSRHPFTELTISAAHRRLLHAGALETLTELREMYWIVRGRQMVKKVLKKCVTCNRFNSRAATGPFAPLPRERVTQAPPFDLTGVDFAGPLNTKDQGNNRKSYIVIFTCAVTRAIHLELVTDMSTSSFLMAFRRFISRRGVCRVIFSDNARTFQRASKDLKRLWTTIRGEEIHNFFTSHQIRWKFIAEKAAWWGGFWERMVRSVKTSLKKVLGNSYCNFEELTTILTEIEAVINSRPLTYVCTEANEPEPLATSHFLVGKRLTTLPDSGSTTEVAQPPGLAFQ